jgi:hypothetical protein
MSLRASVGSNEATSDQAASVSSDRSNSGSIDFGVVGPTRIWAAVSELVVSEQTGRREPIFDVHYDTVLLDLHQNCGGTLIVPSMSRQRLVNAGLQPKYSSEPFDRRCRADGEDDCDEVADCQDAASDKITPLARTGTSAEESDKAPDDDQDVTAESK